MFGWFRRLLNKRTDGQASALSGQTDRRTSEDISDVSSLEFDKESVQLGLAAGYTGRSIHDIHTSLGRIETLMPSKDWLLIQFEENFRKHEENEQKRLETVLKALNSAHLLALGLPEPARSKMVGNLQAVEKSLKISDRMEELIQLVKQYGEVDYATMAQKMVLSGSGFRSLLAMTVGRTTEIEKIMRDNKKYLRYKGSNTNLSGQADVKTPDNQTDKQPETLG